VRRTSTRSARRLGEKISEKIDDEISEGLGEEFDDGASEGGDDGARVRGSRRINEMFAKKKKKLKCELSSVLEIVRGVYYWATRVTKKTRTLKNA
jgi:hypothetical protein